MIAATLHAVRSVGMSLIVVTAAASCAHLDTCSELKTSSSTTTIQDILRNVATQAKTNLYCCQEIKIKYYVVTYIAALTII